MTSWVVERGLKPLGRRDWSLMQTSAVPVHLLGPFDMLGIQSHEARGISWFYSATLKTFRTGSW